MKKLKWKTNKNFLEWLKELAELKDMPLKRRYFDKSYTKMDLHNFSDASLESMCMVAYLRAVDVGGVELSFVIGICRNAPMEQQTIPKLELQAALYSARQAIDDRIPRRHDSDCDWLERLYDGYPMTVLCPWKTASVRGQQSWRSTGPIHCRRMATLERHDESRRHRNRRGHCVTVAWKWMAKGAGLAQKKPKQLARASDASGWWRHRFDG